MKARIIDTHIHIWDLKKAKYAWLEGDKSILNQNYQIEQLAPQLSRAGVMEGVLVQAANNFEDTDLMLETAARTGWLRGVVGWLPLMDPVACKRALDSYTKNPYFKGCRHLIHDEADPRWLLQQPVLESLELLQEAGLPYDIVGTKTAHLETTLQVAEKLPRLKMVLDHLNQPPIPARTDFGRWGELFKEAAQHPNIYAKISGLGTAAAMGTAWSANDLKAAISFALESFGATRCFCGGDWPVALLAGPYEKAWLAYRQILSEELTAVEQQQVFSENAATFYDLPA